MSQIKKPKRVIVSFKDVQIAYLLKGMPGVKTLIKNKKNASMLLRKAVKELKDAGKETKILEEYIELNFSKKSRGRTMPLVGQERVYRAQKLDMGGAFLRLPLSSLGTVKGGQVQVSFEQDRIVVESV